MGNQDLEANDYGDVNLNEEQNSKQLGKSNITSPPDHNSEDAIAVPLPVSPGDRPSAGTGKAFPFKLGRHLTDGDANASTVTLTSQAGVVTPKADKMGKPPGDSLDGQREHSHDTGEMHHHRGTIEPVEDAHGEQADGVDHYDLRNRLPLESENGNELANSAVGPTEERRGTLEDAKGVLHHGPGVIGGIGEKESEGKGEQKAATKPGIDRSDTASLD